MKKQFTRQRTTSFASVKTLTEANEGNEGRKAGHSCMLHSAESGPCSVSAPGCGGTTVFCLLCASFPSFASVKTLTEANEGNEGRKTGHSCMLHSAESGALFGERPPDVAARR